MTPPLYADDVAYLESRLSTDAPMGDLAPEPQRLDGAWLRATEAVLAARALRSYHSGALHVRTGRLVAWTLITKEADQPTHAWQQITIVDPEHRGHRLGTLIKAANLRAFTKTEPWVRAVDTFNAAANTHMIAINDALGMRPIHAFQHWCTPTGSASSSQ